MSRYERACEILRNLEYGRTYAPASTASGGGASPSPNPVPVDSLWAMACQARDARALHRTAALCREILVLDPRHLEANMLLAETEQAEKQVKMVCLDINSGLSNRSLTELMNMAADTEQIYLNQPLCAVVYPGLESRFRWYMEVLALGWTAHQKQEIVDVGPHYEKARKLNSWEFGCIGFVELTGTLIQNRYGG